MYDGDQSITTKQTSATPDSYELHDECLGNGSCTLIVRDAIASNPQITNGSTTWPADWADFPSGNKQIGASALWAGEKVYDYYSKTFGRKSFDDQNHEIDLFINGNDLGHDNAYCNPLGFEKVGQVPNILFFGDGIAPGCNGP